MLKGIIKLSFSSELWALLIQEQWLQLHLRQQQRPLLAASPCHSNRPNPLLPFRLLCRQHWRPSNCPHLPLPPRQRRRSRKSGEIWKLTQSNLIILLSQVVSVFSWHLLSFGAVMKKRKNLRKKLSPLCSKTKEKPWKPSKVCWKKRWEGNHVI